MSKYGARRTVVDGHAFHSAAEARRYSELRLLERSGEITNLELQPRFDLTVNGEKIGFYKGDFRYFSRPKNGVSGEYVTEDVKGIATPLYKFKMKLVRALYPEAKIIEVRV